MRRRNLMIFAIAAVLLVPVLALAIPRPDGAQQVAPESQLGSPITLSANDSVGTTTPLLTNGRSYRLEVSGTWKPSAGTSNFADAAYETTNNSNWTQTNKGFVVASYNAGRPGNGLSYRSDHKYSIQWVGRGVAETIRLNDDSAYNDNSGSVTVTIFQQSKVTYQFVTRKDITPSSLGLPSSVGANVPATSVPLPTVPGPTVPPTSAPVFTVPLLGSVQLYQSGGGLCLRTTVGGTTLDPVACAFNPGNAIPGTGPISLGGVSTPSQSVCQSPPCSVSGIGGGSVPVGGQSFDQTIPAGTSIEITFAWTGDRTHLWYTPADDGSGDRLVAPFNTLSASERDWFQTNAGSVGAWISATVKRPDGTTAFSGKLVEVAGLGQILEAAFETKVQGS